MKKGKRVAIKISVILVFVLAVLAVGVQLTGSLYVKPLIARQLGKVIYEGSDSLYKLNYSNINVNLWTGSIAIHDVNIQADSIRFEQLKNENQLPAISLQLKMELGKITGFNVLDFLINKEIDVNRIITQKADVILYRHLSKKAKENTKTTSVPLWKLIKPDIHKISVGEIVFENIKLAYYNVDTSNSAFQWKFERFDTKLYDILIDSVSAGDTARFLYMANIETNIHKISLSTADSLYEFSVGKLSYSMKNKSAEIEDFNFGPTLSHKDFYKKTGVEKDIYSMEIASLRLAQFKPELFLTDNLLRADTVILSDMKMQIYHDRNPMDDTTSKLGKFPHQMLLKAPIAILIDKVIGNNIAVIYTEKDNKSQKEGKLYFTNITGDASYVTNIPQEIEKHPKLEIKVSGRMMNATTLKGKFMLDLTKTDGSFEAEANISPMDVRVMNPVTEALAGARFKSLKTGNTYYKITGNEFGAYGYLKMPYSDLHLEILQEVELGEEAKGNKIQSLVLKTFSHNANPGVNGEFRIAENVYEQRNIHRSFFNLIWKTLFKAGKDVAMKESAKKIYKKRMEKKAAKGKQAVVKK